MIKLKGQTGDLIFPSATTSDVIDFINAELGRAVYRTFPNFDVMPEEEQSVIVYTIVEKVVNMLDVDGATENADSILSIISNATLLYLSEFFTLNIDKYSFITHELFKNQYDVRVGNKTFLNFVNYVFFFGSVNIKTDVLNPSGKYRYIYNRIR